MTMRHTKIVATLGPASDSDAVLDEMMAAGVDVVRLNFSHGTHEGHSASLERVRRAAARANRHVAVLQDLSGPKIRIGRLEGGLPLALAPGDPLEIVAGDGEGRPGRVYTTYAPLTAALRPGDRLLLDDGRIELLVNAAGGGAVQTTVVFGGALGQHKGINAPGVALPASAMTDKDASDLRFGLGLGVDLVALSFVQVPEDLLRARAVMAEAGRPDVPLLAKIERPEAVANLDALLKVADGIMVARGDLGLELPLEQVPGVQKAATHAARAAGAPVIVATEVLDSMRTQPRPTRAEVSDAANAVDDGVDAIMLSGETAVGVAPGRVVRTLDTIIRQAEASYPAMARVAVAPPFEASAAGAICEAAITLADRGHAQAIVAITRSGRTARHLAALRPDAPIYVLTGQAEVARRLAAVWGVTPVLADVDGAMVASGRLVERLAAEGVLPRGASAVLVSVDPDLSRADANYLRLVTVA
jgi:pyruvate kinase